MKVDQKASASDEVVNQLAALGAVLRSHRVANRLTHEEAAAACQFSRQTLSRIEKGDPSVSIGQVARYASLVGASNALATPTSPAPVDAARRRVRRTQAELNAVAHN